MCKPKYEARLSDGILSVLSFGRSQQGDMTVTHKFGKNLHTTIVRQDENGAHYFRAHGNRVYIADLRRV